MAHTEAGLTSGVPMRKPRASVPLLHGIQSALLGHAGFVHSGVDKEEATSPPVTSRQLMGLRVTRTDYFR